MPQNTTPPQLRGPRNWTSHIHCLQSSKYHEGPSYYRPLWSEHLKCHGHGHRGVRTVANDLPLQGVASYVGISNKHVIFFYHKTTPKTPPWTKILPAIHFWPSNYPKTTILTIFRFGSVLMKPDPETCPCVTVVLQYLVWCW